MTEETPARRLAEMIRSAKPIPDENNPPPPEPDDGAGAGAPPPDDGDGIDWEMVRRCAEEPDTDIGNGRRFLKRFGDDVVAIARIGWHVFDGRRWAEDIEGAAVHPIAHETVEAIRHEAAVLAPTDEEAAAIRAADEVRSRYNALKRKSRHRTEEETEELDRLIEETMVPGKVALDAVRKRRSKRAEFAKSSAMVARIDAMLSVAGRYRKRELSQFDTDPLSLNVGNGTLRFVREGGKPWTVRLDPHRREDLLTKLVEVPYNEEAEAPTFLSFIERVVPDEAVRGFLQRYFGYCCTGITSEQVLAFFYGGGRNGKSTLVDAICKVIGREYSATLKFESIAGEARRSGADATPDLARLPGSRLVRSSEPEQNMQLREATVKELTSSEPILVRRLHQDFLEIYPTFKLVLSGNHKPSIVGTDEGIWRRILLVPFEVQIPLTEVDRSLPDKLWSEREGILAWLVAGALSYLEQGLSVPERIREATKDYREDSDPIGQFLAAACEVSGQDYDFETVGDLYAAYEIYCRKSGAYLLKSSTFAKQLPGKAETFGFRKHKTDGMRIYRGLRIRDEFRSLGRGAPPPA